MNIFHKMTFKLVILTLALAYSLLFAEYFVRIFSPTAIMPRFVTGGSDGIRMNIPGAVYRQKTQEVDIEVRINEQGFRADQSFALDRPHGKCRVAVFGDSFFLGYEANIEDSFQSQLQRQLRDDGHDCEIMNFSVSGFGAAESYIALKERALKYRPDLVVFELHDTDLHENTRSGLFVLENDKLIRANREFLPAIKVRDKLMEYSVYQWTIQNSQLYSSVREIASMEVKKLMAKIKKFNSTSTEVTKSAEAKTTKLLTPRPDPAAKLLHALLQESRNLAEGSGAKFMLVEIPDPYSPPDYHSMLHNQLKPFNIKHNFHIATPRDEFVKPGHQDTLYFYQTGHKHLSLLGNKIVANYTAKLIRKNKLLD